jgi:hypothetical protein
MISSSVPPTSYYRALFEELLEVDDQLRQAHEA